MSARNSLRSVAIVLVLGASVFAQEEPSDTERTAPPVAGATVQDVATPADAAIPDTRPAAGMLPLTLGSFATERSYLLPSLHIIQAMDSNPLMSTQSDLSGITALSGGLELHRVSRGGQLQVNYVGGGLLYSADSTLNSTFQQAGVQQSFEFRRWSLILADDMSYTPESSFGFGQLTGGGNGFAPAQSPNQSILTGQSKRLSNALVGQANYLITARSSITVAGTFGLLRFPGGNLQESNQGGALVGYNHAISPRDTVGVNYSLNMTRFQSGSLGTNFDTHAWQLVYGRRITGKLALQASAGPEIGVAHGVAAGGITTGWATQEALQYRLRKVELNTSYSHTITAGAGVLPGAHTDQAQADFNRRLSRTVDGTLSVGYAHNSNLQAISGSATSAFSTEFVGAGLQRPLNHETMLVLRYMFQHQSGNALTCGLGVCGDVSRHVIGMELDWHTRPLLIH